MQAKASGVDTQRALPIVNHMINYQHALDPIFHAMADGTRRQIIARLSFGPATVTDIAAPLTISLPAVLQHLKVLENARIISSQKIGRTRTCHLDLPALSRAETWIAERRQFWSDRIDRLSDFLTETDANSTDDRSLK